MNDFSEINKLANEFAQLADSNEAVSYQTWSLAASRIVRQAADLKVTLSQLDNLFDSSMGLSEEDSAYKQLMLADLQGLSQAIQALIAK
jgi:hypothetical protein